MYFGMGLAEGNTIVWSDKVDDMKESSIVLVYRLKTLTASTWTAICTAGKEDPRRVFHSLKVGISLTLVSLLYLLEPLFKGIGQNAIWAVMTVVVVLEFTVGKLLVTAFTCFLFWLIISYKQTLVFNCRSNIVQGLK